MKKVKIVMLVLCLCFSMCGCSKISQAKIVVNLNKGEFKLAYDMAPDTAVQNAIIAENFISWVCNDLNENNDSDIELIGGWFGKGRASEYDTFKSSNPYSGIDNYAKLAEYVSELTGNDVLKDYYYGVAKVMVAQKNIVYVIALINLETGEINMSNWTSLTQNLNDTDPEAFLKYVADKVMTYGTELDDDAIERINALYLNEAPLQIEFYFLEEIKK